MYKTGGLEPSNDEKTMSIDGLNYVVSDKMKSMLRDTFIDWGTFLEIYHDNLDYTILFDQIVKILGLKETENLKESMLPLVKKIYELPANAHIAAMLKQFMIFEPVSVAIHSLFTTLKVHFEQLFELFLITRNAYILNNNTKDKINDLTSLKKYWNDMNEEYQLDSSSPMLLFMNPPKGMKSKLNFNVSNHEEVIAKLKDAVKSFHYQGFCPKVPYKRLSALLEFPIKEFVAAIRSLDPDAKFPDYPKIEEHIARELSSLPQKPTIEDNITREEPPKNMTDTTELIQWYVEAILDLRKKLIKYDDIFEDYYIEHAKAIVRINDFIKKELMELNL